MCLSIGLFCGLLAVLCGGWWWWWCVQVEGITLPIMAKALEQARDGRRHILAEMAK
mgnify:CR=1 FL=1